MRDSYYLKKGGQILFLLPWYYLHYNYQQTVILDFGTYECCQEITACQPWQAKNSIQLCQQKTQFQREGHCLCFKYA